MKPTAPPTDSTLTVHIAELWSIDKLAELFGLSTRTVRELDHDGKLPSPLRFCDRSVKWRGREVADWILSGAPERASWHWRPAILPNLDSEITTRTATICDLDRTIAQREQRLAELDTQLSGA
ncbi:MAG: helix-turn-helix transcriptional regulator [Phycisphaerales bacterium]